MKSAFFIALLFISCTRIKKTPMKRYELLMFIEKYKKDEVAVNRNLVIKYRSCYTSRVEGSYDHLAPLKKAFYEKFGTKIIGLANVEIETFRVLDSSIFVPNETCNHFKANPITFQKMQKSSIKEFQVDDEREHVH